MIRFAAIGLDHRHIYYQMAGLMEAGATCAGCSLETSDARAVSDVLAIDRQRLLEDPGISLSAAPRSRATALQVQLTACAPARSGA